MKKIKVGIIGHTGRLGKPLVEILKRHPFADLVYTESRSEGKSGDLSKAECVFLSLPYGESGKYIPKLKGKRIIDLSIDHRNDNDWTYGLPEINREKIKIATKIANPGCYATSILLGLFPVNGKIKQANISSISGISGAGMELSKNDNFLVYKEGKQHPQLKEVKKILELSNVLFVPQRIDTAERGIVSTIFVQSDDLTKVAGLYAKIYKREPFVRIKLEIETKNVIDTNFCDIKILEFGNAIVIISALDNLIKGGVGQAIQNFNLMHGFNETLGLI